MSKETTTRTKVTRDPAILKLAKQNRNMTRWAKDDPEFGAFVENIRRKGIECPLIITEANEVLDGWTRRTAAMALQLDEVPCVVALPEEYNTVVIDSICERKHVTKGQKAYDLAPLLEPAFEEALQRRAHNAAKSNPKNLGSFSNQEEMAAFYGVNYEYLRQARKIYKAFEENPDAKKYGDSKKAVTLRDYIHPRITSISEPMALGDALKAIGYLVAAVNDPSRKNGGKPKDEQVEKQLNLFNKVVTEGFTRWEYYIKWDDSTKAEHWQTVRTKAAALPAEQLEAQAEYHSKLAAELRKAARKEGK